MATLIEPYSVFARALAGLSFPFQAGDIIVVTRGTDSFQIDPSTDIATAFAGDGTVLDSTPNGPTAGVLTAVLLTKGDHLFLAGPASGGPLAPTYRLIVAGDLPADVAYLDVVQTFTKAQRGQQVTVTPSGTTYTPDMSLGQHFNLLLTHGANSLENPTNIAAGQVGMLRITQSSSGGDTLAFDSDYKFASGSAPALSAGANAVDYFGYYVDDATHIVISAGILAVA